MDNPALSYSDMSQDAVLAGVSITAQGLEQRFTEVAARFMKQVENMIVIRLSGLMSHRGV